MTQRSQTSAGILFSCPFSILVSMIFPDWKDLCTKAYTALCFSVGPCYTSSDNFFFYNHTIEVGHLSVASREMQSIFLLKASRVLRLYEYAVFDGTSF